MKDKNTRKEIFESRMYFLIEACIVILGIVLIQMIFRAILVFIESPSLLYIDLFYLFRLIAGLVAVPAFIALTNVILEGKKRKEVIVETSSSQSFQQLQLLGISKSNFKYQLIWGIILLMVVYLPLTLFGYMIPGSVQIEAEIFHNLDMGLGSYFLEPYFLFLSTALIVQICVPFFEEWFFRGYMVNRGEAQFNKYSAVVISSAFFGLSHSGYIFTALSTGENLIYPFFWVISAGIVGFVNASFLIRKKWLFPLIFAHTLSNLVSAHTIWYYSQGGYFQDLFIFLYMPILLLTLLIIITQYYRIKKGISLVASDFSSYFKKDQKLKETGSDRSIRIFVDVLIIISLLLIARVLGL